MNITHLVYFAQVARVEHVSRAARALNISPSAVSHAIARLEEDLGSALFSRSGKRIVLTAQGRRLAERAEEILRSLALLREDMQNDDRSWSGHYRLAGVHALASEVLVPTWVQLAAEHEDLRVDVTSTSTSEILRSTAACELDYALGYSPVDHPDVTIETLWEGPLAVVVRTGHPILERPRAERLQHLAKYPHASVRAVFGTASCEDHPELVKRKAIGRVPLYFNSYEIARSFVLCTDAWAILPEATLSLLSPALQNATDLGTGAPSRIAAMWPKGRRIAEPILALHEMVRTRLAMPPSPACDRAKTPANKKGRRGVKGQGSAGGVVRSTLSRSP